MVSADLMPSFLENLFRHSSNIRGITVTVLKFVMLVLLMWEINRLTVHDIHATFHKNWFKRSEAVVHSVRLETQAHDQTSLFYFLKKERMIKEIQLKQFTVNFQPIHTTKTVHQTTKEPPNIRKGY
jgi:hypothetical protein